MAFVEAELEPLLHDAPWAAEDHIPAEIAGHIRRRSAEHGFYGGDFPADVGGRGVDPLGAALLRIHAAQARCRLASVAMSGPEGPTPLFLLGTVDQRQRYLRPLVEARATRALALTEPQAGSDTSALTCRAVRVGDGWTLNGVKTFVTNAADADVVIVLALTGESSRNVPELTAFLVERGSPGMHVVREIEAMWGGAKRYELLFSDCFVPLNAVLGGELGVGNALFQMLDSLGHGRIAIAATCVGFAKQALALALEHAVRRHAFGVAIARHQHVQEHLVSAHLEIEAAELLVLRAAWRQSRNDDELSDAALAKLAATEGAFRAIDSALQVFGGVGYTRDLPIERLLREVRLYRIVDGTTEIQKLIVAGSLGL